MKSEGSQKGFDTSENELKDQTKAKFRCQVRRFFENVTECGLHHENLVKNSCMFVRLHHYFDIHKSHMSYVSTSINTSVCRYNVMAQWSKQSALSQLKLR